MLFYLQMNANQFSLLFLFALTASVILQLWLAMRHINHVKRHRASVPAEFNGHITQASHQRAADYTVAKTRFGMIVNLFEAMLLAAFTLGGGIEWINQQLSDWISSPLWAGVILIAGFTLLHSLITLPFTLISTFKIEASYGFNNTSGKLFIADTLKTTAVAAAIGLPLLAGVLWLMDQMGAYWWLWVWITWVSFSLLLMWAFPTFIAPIFNKFEPLSDEHLQARIESLLKRCGFKTNGIYVMDGSKRSSHGNAYFTGLGKAKRIVFFDTLLKSLNASEVAAVLAHELGHFKHRHIAKRMLWTFGLMLAMLWTLGQLKQELWFYQGLGVNSSSTATALLLFFLVMPVFTFIFAPLSSMSSRKHEYEADAYAAEQESAADLINALVKLYEGNAATLTPDPLHSLFYDSHPPAALRIAALKKLNNKE
ncbi:M48 family metallopeptidase [Iodobacter fluviatilis]|nr:M48 family metallopeptidase [Iodobacter fluviatilis]